MIKKGTTPSGWEYEIDTDKLNDWALLDLLSEIDEGNLLATPRFIKMVFGIGGKKSLEAFCRESSGRIDPRHLMDVAEEALAAIEDGKN